MENMLDFYFSVFLLTTWTSRYDIKGTVFNVY